MITVFGSINADLVSKVVRHPAAGETVIGSDYEILPGGKGANQALAAKRAGADVRLVGAVGKDLFAESAFYHLKSNGVDLRSVSRHNGTTGVAFITVDDTGENTIIVTPGANSKVGVADLTLPPESLLLTQNEIDLGAVWAAHEKGKRDNVTIIHNAAPAAPLSQSALRNIDYLVINETEAALISGHFGYKGRDAIDSGRFVQNLSERAVVVTIGAKGAVGIGRNDEFTVNSLPVDVVDTTGAGDAFTGAFAASLDRGEDFEKAVELGVVAGSLTCRSVGAQTSIPNYAEIIEHTSSDRTACLT